MRKEVTHLIPNRSYIVRCRQNGQPILFLVRTFGTLGDGKDADYVRERLESETRAVETVQEVSNATTRMSVGPDCKSIYLLIQ